LIAAGEALLKRASVLVDEAMRARLDDRLWPGAPSRLMDAMRYSLFAGGKRFRPALVIGGCEAAGGNAEAALPAACAVEMIHTYSLIHDDLPAMDNDDLRRGRSTLHRAFDEATAILAGDTLLTIAFDALADCGNLDMVRELARAAGPTGMAGGQVLDIEAENSPPDLNGLIRLHRMKTGALIRVSVRMGALAGGASPETLTALTRYGEALGLAFQITDDILDVTGDPEKMGKAAGRDAARQKTTYPSLLGLEESRRRAEQSARDAVDALAGLNGDAADALRSLAWYVVRRDA